MNQELNIVINAQDRTKEAFGSSQSAFTSFKKKVDDLQPTFKKMATIGTVAFGAITASAISMVNAYSDAEADMTVANSSLKNSIEGMTKAQKMLYSESGKTADVMKEVGEAMKLAGEKAAKLGFDDEGASKSFAKLFAITKDSEKATKELAIAQDLARLKGISLEDATQKLVMVHSGATKELKALGIAVDENATAEQNLESIRKSAMNTAEDYAKTTKGQMEIMQVSLGNLKESIGASLQPAIAKILETVQPLIERFAKWAEQNPDLLAKIIMVAGAIAGLVAVLGTLGMILPAIIAFFALLTAPVLVIIGIIVALGVAIYSIIGIFNILKNDSALVWEGIKITINEKITAIKNTITTVLNGIKLVWTTVWTAIKGFFVDIWNAITNTAQSAIQKIKNFLQPVIDMVDKVISKLQSIGQSVGGSIKSAVSKIGNAVGINDGIVQNGQVITTHPDDYIIATKTPESLGGRGGIVVNIMGGNYLDEYAAEKFGNIIISKLQTQMRGS